MGLGSGLVNLFKGWGRGIGNAADNIWLRADAQKAIRDEIEKKFRSKIDLAYRAGNKRADNIKDLDDKLNESKANLKQAQDTWQQNYDAALAGAKTKRQTDIADYDAKLKTYQDALDKAKAGRQSIFDELAQREASYNPTKTIYTDVSSGEKYLVHPITGEYKNITQIFKNASQTQKQRISRYIKGFDERLLDTSSGTPKVINAFDGATFKSYHTKNSVFDNYIDRVGAPKRIDLKNANDQIKQANGNLSTWNTNNNRPADWDDNVDLASFRSTYEKTNGKLPKEYSFNGQNYSKKSDLDKAYRDALAHEQNRKDLADKVASGYVSKRDAEIAQRIQDAKDINKAKVALGGTLGAGALYAGARAIYGGDDTPDNTDNTDNTYTGEPDPNFNIEKEGQAILNNEQQSDTAPINADFDPDKADALAAAAYDKGVEDSNSIESNDDLGNNIAAKTGGHTIDDRLFELLKAMENPYKANAVADYIYSRYGNDPDVQRLGWRSWLNKYYGDSLRSRMNIDPSDYNGMHIA